LDFFVRHPLAALVPALLFLGAYRSLRRRPALVAGIGWLLYTGYELGMQRRWLCSGECNIRVDLFLVYAILAALSLGGIISLVRAARAKGKS
jgi:hypothetical protein